MRLLVVEGNSIQVLVLQQLLSDRRVQVGFTCRQYSLGALRPLSERFTCIRHSGALPPVWAPGIHLLAAALRAESAEISHSS